jgi:hypothetical protein
MTRIALAVGLVAFARTAFPCAFAMPINFSFDKSFAVAGEKGPKLPPILVKSIQRGYKRPAGDSCADMSVIVLTTAATPQSRDIVFDFRQTAGKPKESILSPGPTVGWERAGELLFVFPWLDKAADKHEALDMTCHITAFTKSGVEGGSIDLRVRDADAK